MNAIWTGMIVISVVFALLKGNDGAAALTTGLLSSAESAVAFALGLVGVLAFWSGMLRLAEKAGITRLMARALSPFIRRLFPSIPVGHPASASILAALSANMLGLGNAATPLGIKAMEDLGKLNRGSNRASDAMCTFLALSTSSLTLIPATVIAMRSAAGSARPTAVVGTTVAATVVSTAAAVVFDKLLRGGRDDAP